MQNRNRLLDIENRLMVARGEGVGDWVKKGKGLRSTDWYTIVTGM